MSSLIIFPFLLHTTYNDHNIEPINQRNLPITMAPHKTRFREAAVAYLKECAGTAGDFQQSANGIFEKEDMKRGGSRPVHHATTVAGWS